MAYPDSVGVHVANPHDSSVQRLSTKAAFGELLVGATAVQETIATAGTHLPFADATNMAAGASQNVTVSATNGTLTVTGGNHGKYRVEAVGEVVGENCATTQVSIGRNGIEDANTLRTNVMGASAAYAPFAISKILDLDVGDVITLRGDSGTNCDTISIRAASIRIEKIMDDGPVG